MRDKKGAGHVRGVVDGVLRKIEKSNRKKGNAVLEAWNRSVSEKEQAHSRPVNYKNATIIVLVENSVWLYKFTLEKRDILKRFNENYTGRTKARNIRFRVGTLEE
ncbi:MAG: DUF721 domain-containing protein [Candidatus Omnitrophica bacterium]|nr:DUF721 domain-containing protein [Candidatus Omnitrophota bacterium]